MFDPNSSIYPLILSLILLTAPGEGWTAKRVTYVVKKGDTPAKVAKRHKISVDELLRFNDIRPGTHFRAGTQLVIPRPGEVTGSTYKVRPGDSVAKVADFHGVSQADLRDANGMRADQQLQVGREIVIPFELRGGALASHVVRKGDTLASIARQHKIDISTLATANKLSKSSRLKLGRKLIIPDDSDESEPEFRPQKVNKLVKTGQKVPGGVLHEVQSGQSLWLIARAYNTTGAKIAAANELDPESPAVNAGQKLLIPGARQVVPVRVKGFTIQKVHFVSVWDNQQAQIRLMTNAGKVRPAARRQLSKLARSKRKTKRNKLLHRRLLHMLQRVAERYPGHTIEIVSGYRPMAKGQKKVSKHNQGRAIDFRVRGVPNRELYEYIRKLPRVGAGYYPNSVFVHMDVRDKNSIWTDHSKPGESAQYRKNEDIDPEAAADAYELE